MLQAHSAHAFVCVQVAEFSCDRCGKEVFRGKCGPIPKGGKCRRCKEHLRVQALKNSEPRNCRVCEEPIFGAPSLRVVYHEQCKAKFYKAYHKDYWRKVRPAKQQRQCANCPAMIATNNPRRRFCTTECMRTVQWARRNAERRGSGYTNHIDTISPLAILNRAKWRCQQCKVSTPQRLRGTYEPNAPEVDHIVPLSQGGSHRESNLQCLCRACNQQKGNRLKGQLWLLG